MFSQSDGDIADTRLGGEIMILPESLCFPRYPLAIEKRKLGLVGVPIGNENCRQHRRKPLAKRIASFRSRRRRKT